jgi:hypothetical protein
MTPFNQTLCVVFAGLLVSQVLYGLYKFVMADKI